MKIAFLWKNKKYVVCLSVSTGNLQRMGRQIAFLTETRNFDYAQVQQCQRKQASGAFFRDQ